MQLHGIQLQNPADVTILLSQSCLAAYFRVQLDSFLTNTKIGVVLLDLVESESENFKLEELKNDFSDSTTVLRINKYKRYTNSFQHQKSSIENTKKLQWNNNINHKKVARNGVIDGFDQSINFNNLVEEHEVCRLHSM